MSERQMPSGTQRPATVYPSPTGPSQVDVVNTAVITPTDRVRWGPIIAGLFATLSTLAVLGVLGLALSLSSYDAGEPARNFGIGAGVWGAISALIAFAIGGWVASSTAAVRGRGNGVLNGAMVWVVAIPLLLYLIAGGISSLLNTATTAASNVAAGAASNPSVQATVQNGVQNAPAAQPNIPAPSAQDVQNTARQVAPGAWGALISLILGFLAASFGGFLAARPIDEVHRSPQP